MTYLISPYVLTEARAAKLSMLESVGDSIVRREVCCGGGARNGPRDCCFVRRRPADILPSDSTPHMEVPASSHSSSLIAQQLSSLLATMDNLDVFAVFIAHDQRNKAGSAFELNHSLAVIRISMSCWALWGCYLSAFKSRPVRADSSGAIKPDFLRLGESVLV